MGNRLGAWRNQPAISTQPFAHVNDKINQFFEPSNNNKRRRWWKWFAMVTGLRHEIVGQRSAISCCSSAFINRVTVVGGTDRNLSPEVLYTGFVVFCSRLQIVAESLGTFSFAYMCLVHRRKVITMLQNVNNI